MLLGAPPKSSVLVVDDTPANLIAFRAILEPLGQEAVEVVDAGSGEDALRHLLQRDFAAAVLDVTLPGMDGYEVARLIRSRKRSQRTPIIFVTAFDTPPERIVAAYSQGAVDFLVKPFAPAVLRSKVAFFIELFEKSEQVKWQQEQLLQQQREMMRAGHLAVAGQLAASVAHEVRNPLATIKILVEGALRNNGPRPLTREQLSIMHGQIARLDRIVQEYLDFARPPQLNHTLVDLREVIDQAEALVQPLAGKRRLRLSRASPPEPVLVHLDRDQLCAVLVNLLLNAIEASPVDGDLELVLAAEHGEIEVRVTDSGPGIAPEILHRLFTPFFSTKPNGTGLGLCISKRIVESHGGRISARNRPEGGASVCVRLPASVDHVPLASRR